MAKQVKLPNADQARVDREKITDYVLSPTHPRSKAGFFTRFGFQVEEWGMFAEALRNHGASYPVVRAVPSAYGIRYTVDGPIETPDGRNPRVRTVWMVEEGGTTPRLVTVYPS
jgi:hypothetical protein